MKRNVQKEEENQEEVKLAQSTELSELTALWKKLKELGVNSISDLEVKIARLQ